MSDNYLTEKQIEAFRTQLTTRRQEIIDSRDSGKSNQGLEAIKAPDQVDNASQIEDQNNKLALSDKANENLAEINFALANFSEFGYCLECGEEIGVARLQYNPAFTLCVDCKHISEIEAKGKNGF